jgi:hypothetical protein
VAYLIPKVYDTERMVDILGADEQPKIVKINAEHEDNGRLKHYKVGGDNAIKGKVVVTMGQSYSTKRMESYDFMSSIVQAAPDVLPLIGDIMFRNSDTAGADIIADRFKRQAIKNGLIEDDEQKGQPQLPPQVQQALAQRDQLIAEVHKLSELVEGKQQELASKEKIAQIQAYAQLQAKKMDIDARVTIAEIQTKAQIQSERESWQQELHSDMLDRAHEVGMTAMQHRQGLDASMQDHANTLEQGDQQHFQNMDMADFNAQNQPDPGAEQQDGAE